MLFFFGFAVPFGRKGKKHFPIMLFELNGSKCVRNYMINKPKFAKTDHLNKNFYRQQISYSNLFNCAHLNRFNHFELAPILSVSSK